MASAARSIASNSSALKDSSPSRFSEEPGLLLSSNSGIFFEFVPAAEIFNENPTRLTLRDVKVGENYALIISSNAGLWGYNIGDTVKFVSTNRTGWW